MFTSIIRFFTRFFTLRKRQDSAEIFSLLEFQPRTNLEDHENLKKLSFYKF